MPSITDYIIILLAVFFLYSGWKKGFFSAILNPFCFILGTTASFLYYLKYQNIFITFLIGLLSPFILFFLFSGIVKLKNKVFKIKPELSKLSRFSGSFSCLLWRGAWILVLIISLMIMPYQQTWIKTIQNDIAQSKTYSLLNHILGPSIEEIRNLVHLTPETVENFPVIKEIQDTKEYVNLINNQKFKDFIDDQEIVRHIKNKDMGKLLMNPKMKSLLEDKDFMKNVIKINQSLIEKNLKEISVEEVPLNKLSEEDYLPMQN